MLQSTAQHTHEKQQFGVAHVPSAPLFRAEHVTVRYGASVALQDVTFTLNVGQQVAVVGPNGAGKSTLFKLMVGEIRPSSGHVELFGASPDEHLCVAYVPQHKMVDWAFPATVHDVVMMGRVGRIGLLRWPRRHDREVVAQSLDRVGARHLADKQIGELSGGQKQRVFLARALAQEAELLLLDEPMTGLDMSGRDQLLDLLERITESGLTAIVATHDLNMAAERFDRILLLNRRLVAYGTAQEVLTEAHLASAYSSHLHASNGIFVADTHCDH